MTATDQDNNTATRSVTIRVAGPPPTMTVGVQPLNGPPTTCAQVTLQATPSSIELSKIDYSLDNGATFTEVPLTSNPYTFIVPGSGSFQLLARAFDAAGQIAVGANGFTTSAPCSLLPQITSIAPSSGSVGSSVVIAGSGFGTTQSTSTVSFNGTTATTVGTWSDTSITAVVPTGATTGNIVVTTGAGASNGVGFTVSVPPTITQISPIVTGPVGTPITITGTNFGPSQGGSSVVIGGITASPTSWSDTNIGLNVPSGLPVGDFDVIVTVNGLTSNVKNFNVNPGVSSLSPTFGPPGTLVTISGTSFGATQGTSTVDFCGGQPTSWSDTAIVVSVADVPSGSCVPTIRVFFWNGQTSMTNSNNPPLFFDLSPPVITSLSPTSGQAGSILNIVGSDFGVGPGTVTLNGQPVSTIEFWTPTTVQVLLPSNATSGNVVVTSSHGVASNGLPFVVTPPPAPATFLLSSAASTSPGLLQLASFAGPATTFTSDDLVNQPSGEYLVEAFDTQTGVPNSSNTWSAGTPASFIITLQQVAGDTGTLFPEIKLLLNGPSGTPICSAIGSSPLTIDQTQYNLSCAPSSNLTLSPSDRYYLWVGVTSTAVSSSSLQFQLTVGSMGRGRGSYGVITVPIQ